MNQGELFEKIRTLYRSPDFANVVLAQELAWGELLEELRPHLKAFAAADTFLNTYIKGSNIIFWSSFVEYPCIQLKSIERTKGGLAFDYGLYTVVAEGTTRLLGFTDLRQMRDLETVADFYGKVIELV